MTDFHSHILPGMDDGSDSPEQSLAMLRLSAARNIQTIVATSHYSANYEPPASFLERRRAAYDRLLKAASGETGLPNIVLGAEVRYFEGMSNAEELALLKIEGTGLVLVEMPMTNWTPRMLSELDSIYVKTGLIPIVAHIDRYMGALHKKRVVNSFSGLNVFIQTNAEFFTSKSTMGYALKLLKDGKIHFLGSDCHNMTTRSPNLHLALEVIQARLGADEILRLEKIAANALGGKHPTLEGAAL